MKYIALVAIICFSFTCMLRIVYFVKSLDTLFDDKNINEKEL